MHRLLDILVSGVHDAKNQLFIAESLIAAAEAKHGINLGEARYAIETAANRLSRTISAYQLLRHDAALAIVPAPVSDLCDEVQLAQSGHLARSNILLAVDCPVHDAWPLDRDLVTDMLNNAVQNAGRHARQQVRLSAAIEGDELVLRVEDDGPGFGTLADGLPENCRGLAIGQRLAEMHTRHGRQGRLALSNGGCFGGGVFELRLP